MVLADKCFSLEAHVCTVGLFLGPVLRASLTYAKETFFGLKSNICSVGIYMQSPAMVGALADSARTGHCSGLSIVTAGSKSCQRSSCTICNRSATLHLTSHEPSRYQVMLYQACHCYHCCNTLTPVILPAESSVGFSMFTRIRGSCGMLCQQRWAWRSHSSTSEATDPSIVSNDDDVQPLWCAEWPCAGAAFPSTSERNYCGTERSILRHTMALHGSPCVGMDLAAHNANSIQAAHECLCAGSF